MKKIIERKSFIEELDNRFSEVCYFDSETNDFPSNFLREPDADTVNVIFWDIPSGKKEITKKSYFHIVSLVALLKELVKPVMVINTQFDTFGAVLLLKTQEQVSQLKANHMISAILPVYNEEQTLLGVLNKLLEHPLIDEVVTINDGSSDSSLSILQSVNHKKHALVNLDQNRGKGGAVAAGFERSCGNIIMMIDSDLENVLDHHIDFLVSPLLFDVFGYKSVLGLRGLPNRISLVTKLTGERAYRREDFKILATEIGKTRYGIETILNDHFEKLPALHVNLVELSHPMKYQKGYGLYDTFRQYTEVAIEVAKTDIKLRHGKLVKKQNELLELIDSQVLHKIRNSGK